MGRKGEDRVGGKGKTERETDGAGQRGWRHGCEGMGGGEGGICSISCLISKAGLSVLHNFLLGLQYLGYGLRPDLEYHTSIRFLLGLQSFRAFYPRPPEL